MPKPRRRRERQRGPSFTTTVTLPRSLYDRARIQAIREHLTFREFMERALRTALAHKEETNEETR